MIQVVNDVEVESAFQQLYHVPVALLIEARAVLGAILPYDLDRLKVLECEPRRLRLYVHVLFPGRVRIIGRHRRTLDYGRLP